MAELKRSSFLAWGLLVVALVIFVDQIGLLTEAIYPLRLGIAQWRFTSVGAASLRFSPLLLGDALLLTSAVFMGARGWLRTLGVVHVLLAVAMAGVLVLFALDAIQMRRAVRLDLLPGLTAGSARVAAMTVLLAAFSLWAGIKLLRAPVGGQESRNRGQRPLVVGAARGEGEAS